MSTESHFLSAAVVNGNTMVIIRGWWQQLTGADTDGPLHASYHTCGSLYRGLFLEKWEKMKRQSLGDRLLIIRIWVNDFWKCMRWLNALDYFWRHWYADVQDSVGNLFIVEAASHLSAICNKAFNLADSWPLTYNT